MKSLMNLVFSTLDGTVEKNADKSVSFVAKRKGIGERFFPENTCFTYEAKQQIEFEEYIVMEYSAFGLFRVDGVKPAFFSVEDVNGWQKLFIYDDFTFDNRMHRVIVKAPTGNFTGIKADYFVDKILEAKFTLLDFYTCSRDELPCPLGTDNFETNTDGMKKIDLSEIFNGEYSGKEYDSMIDSGRFFETERISLFGVPFSVKTSGNNIVVPDAPPSENDDVIENFGAMAKRRECRPVSRDNETEIVIDADAEEIYFILTLSGKRHIRTRYGTNGEVLGSEYVDLYMPLCVEDTEFFMAEVVYADGRHDTHLPLNLSTGKHGISGDISVYAVPCDGTRVEKLIIHNRMLDTDVCLAAVTVNESDKRLHPEMLIPEKTLAGERKIQSEKGFVVEKNVLEIKNGAIRMKVDLSHGLKLLKLTNDFAPDMKVEEGSMLLLRTADGELNEDFEFGFVQHYADCAKITYTYKGVCFDVTADISNENSVRWTLEVNNKTNEVFKSGVIFPCIRGIDYGSFGENWYFVPKYQNLCSNETFYMYEESAPSFPMQFMDTFSPKADGGLCITTEEKELVTRKYCLDKTGDTIEMYVEYPVMYGDYKPGEGLCAPAAVISAHEGGWKSAFSMYKKWLDGWYTPYKCQNKQWYRECFWLLAEITDFFDTDEIFSFPCWYKKENDEFMFRKILEEQKSISGIYPDIIHMWSWCNMWRNGAYGQRWGNYGEEDYALYGGRENFRNALHDIRDNMGVQVSLYMHPTLLSNSYKKAEKFYKTSMVKTESGGTISIENDSFRMCHAEEGWREETLSNYPRIYKELGIPLLYVDEFSLRVENRCYEDSHGHHVPSSLLKTDREFISRLKDIMPEEVVLYGEYAAVDVNARYIDCNISYYILDSIVDMVETARRAGDGDDRLSRVFTNVYRFAFPKIVQLILPMAMRKISWHPQKFMFFNGEAVYDSFWDTEESRGAAFNVKAQILKKKYADCFTSNCPETMIETESPAICMNKFPAENRTLYTVYNRAYSTYRGKALRVPHKDGQTYYDAWNDRILDVEIKEGYAEISIEIDAMQMGCIVVE